MYVVYILKSIKKRLQHVFYWSNQICNSVKYLERQRSQTTDQEQMQHIFLKNNQKVCYMYQYKYMFYQVHRIIPNQKIEVLMQLREYSKQKIWDNPRGSIYFPIPWHLVNLYFLKFCFLVNLFQSKVLNKLN